jgi:hypothetical protein
LPRNTRRWWIGFRPKAGNIGRELRGPNERGSTGPGDFYLSEKDPVLIVVQYGTADEVVDELGFEGAALGIGKCAILRVREP